MSSVKLHTSDYMMFGSFGTRGNKITVSWNQVEYITELFEVKKDKTRKAVGTTIHFTSGQMVSVSAEYRLVRNDMLFGKG